MTEPLRTRLAEALQVEDEGVWLALFEQAITERATPIVQLMLPQVKTTSSMVARGMLKATRYGYVEIVRLLMYDHRMTMNVMHMAVSVALKMGYQDIAQVISDHPLW